jgi:hypothetical protein
VSDSEILRRAAIILRRNSTKPNGLWMNVICKVLTDLAYHLVVKA